MITETTTYYPGLFYTRLTLLSPLILETNFQTTNKMSYLQVFVRPFTVCRQLTARKFERIKGLPMAHEKMAHYGEDTNIKIPAALNKTM